jgi:cellulose synthase/poly-beta-1,6-N-acetylglucosamine synthase-like glycosyltransferase
MIASIITATLLALLPACNTFINLLLLRTPAQPMIPPRLAILIPARDEEATIGACVDSALASAGADIEVIVLDDGSRDATRSVVEERALNDRRVRLAAAPPLPPGWTGKQHACQILSTLTDRPFLLFVDADVRLAPTAAARLVPAAGVDLVSGVPRQRVASPIEAAVVPMINSLIFGYLPVALMRLLPHPALTAACGQMIMVRAAAYRKVGGHAAIAGSMHDGMQLARQFRRSGYRTDLVDGTWLADCRMYDNAAALFAGFAKNATEGMARPMALPVWTVLLVGGHLMPVVLVLLAIATESVLTPAGLAVSGATTLLVAARVLQAVKCREPWLAVVLHPVGVILTLAIQWRALYRYFRGRLVVWRGRSYAPTM